MNHTRLEGVDGGNFGTDFHGYVYVNCFWRVFIFLKPALPETGDMCRGYR